MCKLIQLPGGGTAFMCNCKQDHECNDDAAVLLLEDGIEVPDTIENAAKFLEQIRGGSVACTICGRSSFSMAHRIFDDE